jgi:hypothetical protein
VSEFRTSQQLDYPVYDVDIELVDTVTEGSGGSLQFSVLGTQDYTALLAGIKSWAEGFSWPPSGGQAIAFQSMTVTKRYEASTDVSPS